MVGIIANSSFCSLMTLCAVKGLPRSYCNCFEWPAHPSRRARCSFSPSFIKSRRSQSLRPSNRYLVYYCDPTKNRARYSRAYWTRTWKTQNSNYQRRLFQPIGTRGFYGGGSGYKYGCRPQSSYCSSGTASRISSYASLIPITLHASLKRG